MVSLLVKVVTLFLYPLGLQMVNLFIILVVFKKTEQIIFTERTKFLSSSIWKMCYLFV